MYNISVHFAFYGGVVKCNDSSGTFYLVKVNTFGTSTEFEVVL